MSPEDLQAQALADWLAAHPGADPPEGVDPDVVEAVYMLRPDLAPAPRVSVDDILAGMDASLFAGADTPVPAPVVSEIVDAPEVPKPANRSRMWAVVGSVAAMAAAVLVVGRVALNGAYEAPDQAMVAEPTMEWTSAPQAEEAERQAGEAPRGRDAASPQREQAIAGRSPTTAGGPSVTVRPSPSSIQAPSGAITVQDAELDAVADLGIEQELEELSVAGNARGDNAVTGEARTRSGDQAFGFGTSELSSRGAGDAPQLAQQRNDEFDAVADLDDGVEMEDLLSDRMMEEPVEAEEEWSDDAQMDGASGGVVGGVVGGSAPAPPPPPAQPSVASRDRSVADEVEVVSVESTSGGGGLRWPRIGGRRDASRAEEASAPPAVAAPQMEPSPDVAEGNAATSSAQAHARQLAASQQYARAFAVLSPYVSPSAPMSLVVDAADYAFAAGQWQDVIGVARTRLDNRMPSDSAQDRAHLFDLKARAEAMLVPDDEATMRMDQLMEASPPE